MIILGDFLSNMKLFFLSKSFLLHQDRLLDFIKFIFDNSWLSLLSLKILILCLLLFKSKMLQ